MRRLVLTKFCASCLVNLVWDVVLRASPPCRVKGTWQALEHVLGEKPASPLPNTEALIAKALQTSGFTHYPRG